MLDESIIYCVNSVRFLPSEQPFEYMSGGAGYVLSRGAVGSLFSFLDRPEQSEEREHSGPEDLHMGGHKCLGKRVTPTIVFFVLRF